MCRRPSWPRRPSLHRDGPTPDAAGRRFPRERAKRAGSSASDLADNREGRCPLRPVLTLAVINQPHRSFTHLGRILALASHDPILSRIGVSRKPGAVQAEFDDQRAEVLVSPARLERATNGLKVRCSTN